MFLPRRVKHLEGVAVVVLLAFLESAHVEAARQAKPRQGPHFFRADDAGETETVFGVRTWLWWEGLVAQREGTTAVIVARQRLLYPGVTHLLGGVRICGVVGRVGDEEPAVVHGACTGGEVVAKAIADGDETYKLFAPFGLDFAGGPFGPLIAQWAYWGFQMQDRWQAWRSN